jgi:hypothetical protein
VDRVFLTENAPEPGTELVNSPVLEKFVKEGFLKLASEPKPHAQTPVYGKCIREQWLNFNWIAFFDMDEFLVVRECAALACRLPQGCDQCRIVSKLSKSVG